MICIIPYYVFTIYYSNKNTNINLSDENDSDGIREMSLAGF